MGWFWYDMDNSPNCHAPWRLHGARLYPAAVVPGRCPVLAGRLPGPSQCLWKGEAVEGGAWYLGHGGKKYGLFDHGRSISWKLRFVGILGVTIVKHIYLSVVFSLPREALVRLFSNRRWSSWIWMRYRKQRRIVQDVLHGSQPPTGTPPSLAVVNEQFFTHEESTHILS